MRFWVVALMLVLNACGPSFSVEDKQFERRLAEAAAEHGYGEIGRDRSAALLRDAFGESVEHVCFVYGGDWEPDVAYQWEHAKERPPISVEQLRRGNGDLSYDGMVAIVGVTPNGEGIVRRGWYGDSLCSDHSGGPYCWRLDRMTAVVVRGSTPDAGPHAGETRRALQFTDLETGAQSCRLEPGY
jgi:hypothetical protein